MRDALVGIGRWLLHVLDLWRTEVVTGANALVHWLGVGWLVVLAVIALSMAMWGLKVHRG